MRKSSSPDMPGMFTSREHGLNAALLHTLERFVAPGHAFVPITQPHDALDGAEDERIVVDYEYGYAFAHVLTCRTAPGPKS
jgi:hypothetical protein